jgi:peroxiredoxin
MLLYNLYSKAIIMTKLIKPIICIAFILTGLNVSAQITILQNTIDKLGSYKNFSYQYVYKQKDAFGDTLINKGKCVLLKMPDNREGGYFFRNEAEQTGWNNTVVELFNGEDLTTLYLADRTFKRSAAVKPFQDRVITGLNWLKTFADKNPAKVRQVNDTTIRSASCYHLVFTTRDTIINKEHLYTRIHLLIDKVTGLPLEKFIRARTDSFGKEVADYYTRENYFNYKTEQGGINRAYFDMPAGFRPAKEMPRKETALLAVGTTAPDWTLYDTEGKKTALSQLKGKVVLMDFFFVGCGPCMKSLAPLERLCEKYKDKGFVLLSISDRDSKKLVAEFKKVQRIKNQMYPDGGNVARLYHVTAAPTFYFIDREGKITHVVLGCDDDFEQKMSVIIDNLLKKS